MLVLHLKRWHISEYCQVCIWLNEPDFRPRLCTYMYKLNLARITARKRWDDTRLSSGHMFQNSSPGGEVHSLWNVYIYIKCMMRCTIVFSGSSRYCIIHCIAPILKIVLCKPLLTHTDMMPREITIRIPAVVYDVYGAIAYFVGSSGPAYYEQWTIPLMHFLFYEITRALISVARF